MIQLEKYRHDFLWAGNIFKNKMLLVSWNQIRRLKDLGAQGVTPLRVKKLVLLGSWWSRTVGKVPTSHHFN